MLLPLLLRNAEVSVPRHFHSGGDGYLLKEKTNKQTNKESGHHMPLFPVLTERRKPEDQEFKVILMYILSLRSAWDTGDVTSKHKLSCCSPLVCLAP